MSVSALLNGILDINVKNINSNDMTAKKISSNDALVRSVAGAGGINASLSLSNLDISNNGVYYTHELNRVGQPYPNEYNLILNTSGAAPQTILNIIPINSTTTDLTLAANDIFLDGIVRFIGGANQCGIIPLTIATPSTTVHNIFGLATNAVVLLTQSSGAPLPNLSYSIATAGQLTIHSSAVAAATNCAYFVVQPSP